MTLNQFSGVVVVISVAVAIVVAVKGLEGCNIFEVTSGSGPEKLVAQMMMMSSTTTNPLSDRIHILFRPNQVGGNWERYVENESGIVF